MHATIANRRERRAVQPADAADTPLLADYLTDTELAAELNVSVRTIWRWRELRLGPPTTYVGKTPYARRQAVKEWLAEREQKQARGSAR
jgi:hypothetical protein